MTCLAKRKTWEDIYESPTEKFADGSSITQVHEKHQAETYSLAYEIDGKEETLVISEDHCLLCYTGFVFSKKALRLAMTEFMPDKIKTESDHHVGYSKQGQIVDFEEPTKFDSPWVSRNVCWLNAYSIHYLKSLGQDIRLVQDASHPMRSSVKLTKASWSGLRECFCVSTNTKRYKACGVIHHNSVALRNVIFHSLTHSNDIKLALVDLKLSEFSKYKDMKDVVGVANSVLDATELLTLAREIMYERNAKNAEAGITDIRDYKPTQPTDKVMLYGQEFNENTEFEVEIAGEKKTMTAKEILDYMQE